MRKSKIIPWAAAGLAFAAHVAATPFGGEDSGGCIWCHRSATDGDYIFYPEIRLPGWEYSER